MNNFSMLSFAWKHIKRAARTQTHTQKPNTTVKWLIIRSWMIVHNRMARNCGNETHTNHEIYWGRASHSGSQMNVCVWCSHTFSPRPNWTANHFHVIFMLVPSILCQIQSIYVYIILDKFVSYHLPSHRFIIRSCSCIWCPLLLSLSLSFFWNVLHQKFHESIEIELDERERVSQEK